MKQTARKIGALAILAGTVFAPMAVQAQSRSQIDWEIQQRNRSRNEWKTIATVSGAAAILGLLNKDNTLTFAGTAGALYSMYRYNEDGKSRDRLARARADFFSHDHFYRDGVRYDRRVVTSHGQKYYQFYRAPRVRQDWNRGLPKGWVSGHDNGPIRPHDQGHKNGPKQHDNGHGRGHGNGKGHGND